MKDKPGVAIIILNWNTSHYLKRFLPAALSVTYDNVRIYVIDNNSSDDSLAMLKADFPGVNVIAMNANAGFASAYNHALKTISCDYFLIVNSDIEVTPGFIDPVIELMESDPLIAICQPKLLSLEDKQMFEYAGASGGWIDKLGYPFTRGRILLTIEKDSGQYDSIAEVFWASGACMFVKSEIIKKIGGFYDYYYMHQEDIDLCWRARNVGYKICACPSSTVYHIGGGTLSWQNHLKTFLTFRNNYILLTRNLPKRRWIPLVSLRLMTDMGGCLYFLVKRKGGISKAIFTALFAYVYWLFFVGNKKNSQPKGFGKGPGIYPGSILFPYYLQKKRKFSELSVIEKKRAAS